MFVGTEAGGNTSPAGLSPAFDTLAGPKALIDSIGGAGVNKLAVKWHPAAVTDPNPGDPLDLPAVPPQYEIIANYNNFNRVRGGGAEDHRDDRDLHRAHRPVVQVRRPDLQRVGRPVLRDAAGRR